MSSGWEDQYLVATLTSLPRWTSEHCAIYRCGSSYFVVPCLSSFWKFVARCRDCKAKVEWWWELASNESWWISWILPSQKASNMFKKKLNRPSENFYSLHQQKKIYWFIQGGLEGVCQNKSGTGELKWRSQVYWRQQSRVHWLAVEDGYTKFYVR